MGQAILRMGRRAPVSSEVEPRPCKIKRLGHKCKPVPSSPAPIFGLLLDKHPCPAYVLVERPYRISTQRGSRPPHTLPGETGLRSGPFPVTVPSSEAPRTLGGWNEMITPCAQRPVYAGLLLHPGVRAILGVSAIRLRYRSSRSRPRTFKPARASQGRRRRCLPGDPVAGVPSHGCRTSADSRPCLMGSDGI
jgi:hypothetical protein